jgi:hypothetical protein
MAEIDAANASDPNLVTDSGATRPAEVVYGERMSAVLARLYPAAGELLKIAARAQHIKRWTVPRSRYPMDRAGYLRWRNDLKRLHADLAGEIMERNGYAVDDVARVRALIRKENLKRDPEAQALEDTACIVFLEYYAPDFAEKHDDAKMVTILRKTWVKMSSAGQSAALALPLPQKLRGLIDAALVERI